MDQWFWACVQRGNDIIMPVKVGTSKMDSYSVHYNFWENTICMPSFNPRKWLTTQMIAREFKSSRIIRKLKICEIKVTRKFPNLQYLNFQPFSLSKWFWCTYFCPWRLFLSYRTLHPNEMPLYAALHLGFQCLPKCLFTSIQNEKFQVLKTLPHFIVE